MTCFTDKICKSSYLSKKKKKKCKISYLGLVWLKKMVTHHSSLITQFSSLVTDHLSFKIPQLPTPHPFGTITQIVITQNFQLFVGPILVT